MQRRKFLTATAAGAAAVAAFPMPAISQNLIRWRMVTAWPKNAPGTGQAAARIAQRIGELTGGRLTIEVYGAGEIVPAFGAFDAVAQGTAEIYHAVPAYWTSKMKGIGFFGSCPFGLTAPEQMAWMYHGGGYGLYDEAYGGFGVKGFICGNSGPQWMGWFRKEITSLDDFRGLRFRTTGIGAEMYGKAGAAVVAMPGAEIFQALQSGTLDAAEFIGPWADAAFGFYQVAKFYYYPGVQEPSSAEEIGMNKAAYDGLPDDLKLAIRTAAMAASEETTTSYDVNNAKALTELTDKHGVQVREAPEDLLVALGNAAGEVVRELLASDDAMTKKIAESYVAFRNMTSDYAAKSYAGQMNARLLPFTWA